MTRMDQVGPMTRTGQTGSMTQMGQEGPKTQMGWDGSARQLGRVMPDDLYGLGKLDDPNWSSGPDNPNGSSRLDDSDRQCQTTHTNQAGRCPNGPNGPKDLDGLGLAGPTIRTGRARWPVQTEQARDLMGWASFTTRTCWVVFSLKHTTFRKFNLKFFYKKWILDFKLDPNI